MLEQLNISPEKQDFLSNLDTNFRIRQKPDILIYVYMHSETVYSLFFFIDYNWR